MIERTEFHRISNLSLTPRIVEKDEQLVIDGIAHEGDVVLCRRDNQDIVAIINPDYIFDKNGNRFSF